MMTGRRALLALFLAGSAWTALAGAAQSAVN
jgi:hypothetical protein